MPSYKPISITVSTINNGDITNADAAALAQWDRTLIFGVATDSESNPLQNAAINVIRLAAPGGEETSLGIVFTDASGKYGVSLPILTGTEVYRFDVYSPVV